MDPKKIVLLNLVYPGGHLASSRHGRISIYILGCIFGICFLDFWDRSDPKVPVPITKLWYPKRNWVEIFFARTGGLQLPLAAGVLFLYFGTEFCTAGTRA